MRRVSSARRGPLASCPEPLSRHYDVALLDLDGVVYVGQQAVPAAPEALAKARAAGMRLAFVTNNAARPARVVAEHLVELGIPAREAEVTTSAQAAAHYLADRLAPGATVLVLGADGLLEALTERGLRPVQRDQDDVAAVVQGYSPQLGWRDLAEGAVAINRGVLWVATNLDPTVPSPRGRLPGNGSLVAALRHATGIDPVATGKPDPTMHRESVERSGARRPIVVGDRLDTDIEGANAAPCDSLLVFSGVTAPAELLVAPPRLRPTYVASDVAGLLRSHRAPVAEGDGYRCGAWTVVADGADVCTLSRVTADSDGADGAEGEREGRRGVDEADGLDALRVLCAAAWAALDRGARVPADQALDRLPAWHAGNEPAETVLAAFGLAGA